MNSRKISASIIIDSPVEDVWKILTDYDNLATHVPNLVKSNIDRGTNGELRLFQEGAQKIIGFDFRASLTMDMTEQPVDQSSAYKSRRLDFKLVESAMFSAFEGTWSLRCHSRVKKMDPHGKIESKYLLLLTYTVLVKPKGLVPVMALEWRIKEDVPINLLALQFAAENLSMKASQPVDVQAVPNRNNMVGWGSDETLGMYMATNRNFQSKELPSSSSPSLALVATTAAGNVIAGINEGLRQAQPLSLPLSGSDKTRGSARSLLTRIGTGLLYAALGNDNLGGVNARS